MNKVLESSESLSNLSVRGAGEIDNYLLGRNNNFACVKYFEKILKIYPLKGTDTLPASSDANFYLSVWRAIKHSKQIPSILELSLSMNLLEKELKAVPDSNHLEELRSFLCNLSVEFSREKYTPAHF